VEERLGLGNLVIEKVEKKVINWDCTSNDREMTE